MDGTLALSHMFQASHGLISWPAWTGPSALWPQWFAKAQLTVLLHALVALAVSAALSVSPSKAGSDLLLCSCNRGFLPFAEALLNPYCSFADGNGGLEESSLTSLFPRFDENLCHALT